MTTSSTNVADLRTLVEESDAFAQCEDCGRHVVNLGGHRCPTETDSPATNLAARRARAERDARDDDDEVGVFRRTAGHTYAYHELDGDTAYCGCGEYTKARRFEIVTRAEAKELGRSPCGNCERLRRLRDD